MLMVEDMSDKRKFDVIVVGGGIFGCLTAIELSKKGLLVGLLEKNEDIMVGASLNNQNRLHLGYHYPRDLETAFQCQRGFDSFRKRFSDCILDNFDNIYFISSKDSNVSFKNFKGFCKTAKLVVKEVDISKFTPQIFNVEGGLYTNEVVYDSKTLRRLVLRDLNIASIDVMMNSNVKSIKHQENGFVVQTEGNIFLSKAVVNCTYANFNDFSVGLNIKPKKLQYELTVVPVVKWREGLEPIGITVMDGKFFTVLPFGKSNNYLLYHVDHTVQETTIGFKYPSKWRNPKSYIHEDVAREVFQRMVESSSNWLPDILNAEFVDYLTTVRVVLAEVETSDSRPSLITKLNLEKPFYTIFSGKIDHSIWVAHEITEKLYKELT